MRVSFIPAFLLVSIASVFALNLNDIDTLTTNDVTPECLDAYSQDISECPSASDFEAKKTCTSSCVDALNAHQQTVIAACEQAFVNPDSLIRRILDHGLVITLCPVKSSSSASTTYTFPDSVPTTSAATETSTITPTSDPLSGFLTVTISSADASITSIPSELTLDGSAEPTVDTISAFAQNSDVSSVEHPATSTSSGTPSESAPSNATTGGPQTDANSAGSVKAVWASVVIGFSVALGATLL